MRQCQNQLLWERRVTWLLGVRRQTRVCLLRLFGVRVVSVIWHTIGNQLANLFAQRMGKSLQSLAAGAARPSLQPLGFIARWHFILKSTSFILERGRLMPKWSLTVNMGPFMRFWEAAWLTLEPACYSGTALEWSRHLGSTSLPRNCHCQHLISVIFETLLSNITSN